MRTFKHSGKLGDIVYSLPAVIASGGGTYCVATEKHPEALSPLLPPSERLSEAAAEGIVGLLRLQPCVREAVVHDGRRFDTDLDLFRAQNWREKHLARCHLDALRLRFDLGRPWLENVPAHFLNEIVVAHSGRYVDSIRLDWDALRGLEKRCVFIGTGEEHARFTERTGLRIAACRPLSVLEFAGAVRACSVFAGNQSFGFALAEALKRPRALEASLYVPNALPQSPDGHLGLKAALREAAKPARHGRAARWRTAARNALFLRVSAFLQTRAGIRLREAARSLRRRAGLLR